MAQHNSNAGLQHGSGFGGPITSNSSSSKQQQFMSKVLAHSTSLLANDSYMAGMSSDSELTSVSSSNRHHHRPYSSQSRVYHAHPAPRSSQSSSRMSHHSDPVGGSSGNNNSYMSSGSSTASTMGGSGKVVAPISSSSSSQQQQQQQQASSTGAHLSHQGSVSSSGSGSGIVGPQNSAYLRNMASDPSMLMQQQQQQALPRAPTSRQLPQRPFKQSMSIDHHSAGQYHHQLQQQQHLAALGQQHQSQFIPPMAASSHHQPLAHHQYNPYADLPTTTTTTTIAGNIADTNSAYQQQHQSLASTPPTGTLSYPSGSLGLAQVRSAQMMLGSVGHGSGGGGSLGSQDAPPNSQHQPTRYAERQRNFMLEMEMLDKRTAAVNLNAAAADNELLQAATSSPAVQHPPPTSAFSQVANSSSNSTLQQQQQHHLPTMASSSSSSSSSRQRQMLPPNQAAAAALGSTQSVDHLNHQLEQYPPQTADIQQQQQQQHYHSTSQLIMQQQQLQQQQQQQKDLYSPHHLPSTPSVDWLPPIGPSHPYAPPSAASHQSPQSQQQQYHHHLPRTGGVGGGVGPEGQQQPSVAQFKQAASIDHYPVNVGHHQQQQQQQQQQRHQQPHHFSSARSSHFNEHYRCSSLAYAPSASVTSASASTATTSGSPVKGSVYELSNQQQPGSSGYHSLRSTTNELHHNEVPYHHQYAKEQQQQQQQAYSAAAMNPTSQQMELQQQHHHQQQQTSQAYDPSQQHYSLADNFNQPPVRSAAVAMASGSPGQQQIQRPKLQHQLSSSSSNNSQSGSLKSSNLDISKQASSSAVDQQQQQQKAYFQQQSPKHQPSGKSSSANYNTDHLQQQQQQQHRHGALRKGYTSVASSLAGSNLALNELLDPPLSATHTSSLAASQGAKRPALRASSPSSAYANEATTSSGGNQLNKHHLSSSYSRDVGSSASGGRAGGAGGVGASSGGAGSRSESSTGLPNGSSNNSSLTKKSNSATQLSMTGTKKRLGFRKKQVTSFSVYRSEEVAPLEARHLVKQGSSVSEGESSLSGDSSSRSWSNSNFKQPTPEELASMSFIDGLGKGQMISRQGLASPYLGDIQLSLCDRRGNLEVEVIRARNLQAKANKILPLTYVKLYLVKNRKCLAKAKTTLCNKRTLDPLFQQQLVFHEDYHGSILQSIVWGNFGKMDKKNFMGIAQISIDDLELNDTVISWYKLFLPSSLQTLPSKSLRHTLLSNSTESFTTNTNNS